MNQRKKSQRPVKHVHQLVIPFTSAEIRKNEKLIFKFSGIDGSLHGITDYYE
ncbi:MAG: hypothetical protein V4665_04540 [Patescibacteria group bacterium]